MQSRRAFLGVASASATAVLAGCSILGSSDSGHPPGEEWLASELATVQTVGDGSGGQSGGVIGELEYYETARAHGIDQFPDRVLQSHPGYSGRTWSVSVPPQDVDAAVSVTNPDVAVLVGDLDADAAADQLPEEASDAESSADATTYTWESTRMEGTYRGAAVDDDRVCEVRGLPSAGDAVVALEGALDVAAGDGSSIADRDPLSRITSFLESGVYERYVGAGSNTPRGISLSVDGDEARRRSTIIHAEEAAAEANYLLDEGFQESSREPADPRPPTNFAPYTSLEIERDGRQVTVDGTLPTAEIGGPEFRFP